MKIRIVRINVKGEGWGNVTEEIQRLGSCLKQAEAKIEGMESLVREVRDYPVDMIMGQTLKEQARELVPLGGF